MSYTFLEKVQRAVHKPPSFIVRRLLTEANRKITKAKHCFITPSLSKKKLLGRSGTTTISDLFMLVTANANKMFASKLDITNALQSLPAEQQASILRTANQAIQGQFRFLGHDFDLDINHIDWDRDYVSGKRWPSGFCHDIQVNNLDENSDVKIPWEISRLQWLIPVTQAYLMTGKAHYAESVQRLVADWIDKNPLAYTVNWSCTMDVAIRAISLCWFMFVFGDSACWQQKGFAEKILISLFGHGLFIEKNLEYADVNGNHLISDAAGLVFLGLLFDSCTDAKRWLKLGWKILETEIIKQTSKDGVNFEASIPYHRLAAEIFLYPALVSRQFEKQPPGTYKSLMNKMAVYIDSYTRPDGSVPLLGDGDDGRILPFCFFPINDHRYLIDLISSYTKLPTDGRRSESGSPLESICWFGAAHSRQQFISTGGKPTIEVFEPGYCIMQHKNNHVFIDCAEVGMNGKGGHGHNDCLSFTLMLGGCLLFEDRGCATYTRDYKSRNLYRSTCSHNIPQIAGKEINRFIAPKMLWNLRSDINPRVIEHSMTESELLLCGELSSAQPERGALNFKRTIQLSTNQNELILYDQFLSQQGVSINIPFYLARAIKVSSVTKGQAILMAVNGLQFLLVWDESSWSVSEKNQQAADSYGNTYNTDTLLFTSVRSVTGFRLKVCQLRS